MLLGLLYLLNELGVALLDTAGDLLWMSLEPPCYEIVDVLYQLCTSEMRKTGR